MGRKIVLTGTKLTDLTAPRLKRYDPIEAAGSLMLIEPAHPVRPWSAGLPADASVLTNAVDTIGAAVIGQPASAVRPSLVRPASFTGSAGLLERTGKGALHGITSQAGSAIADGGAGIAIPTAVTKYILDNYLHQFYFSMWGRITRVPTSVATGLVGIAAGSQQSNACEFYLGARSDGAWTFRPSTPGSPSYLGDTRSPSTSGAGNFRVALGAKDFYGREITGLPATGNATPQSGARATSAVAFGALGYTPSVGADGAVGVNRALPNTSNKDTTASWVLYRFYLEDLTVSGRTFAQVEALDAAMYAEALGAGGRYSGDTFTNPSTIP